MKAYGLENKANRRKLSTKKEESKVQGKISSYRHPHFTRQKGIHSCRKNSRC